MNRALNAAYVNEKCTSSLNRFKEKEVVVDMRSHLAPHDLVLLLEGELHSKYTYISNSNENDKKLLLIIDFTETLSFLKQPHHNEPAHEDDGGEEGV
jgi:hypothetical protein